MSKVEKAMLRAADAEIADNAKRTAVPPTHFTVSLPRKAPKKALAVASGKGVKLGEIAYVAKQISKRENNDKTLQLLHRTIYGAPAKATVLKRNVRQFNGVVYGADLNRAKMQARLGNRNLKQLRDIARIVGVEGGSRADLEEHLLSFFEKPVETELAKKDAKKPVKKAAKKSAKKAGKKTAKKSTKKEGKKEGKKSTKKAGKKETKKAGKKAGKKDAKKEKGPKKPTSAYMFYVNDNRADFVAKNPNLKPTEVISKIAAQWKALSADKKKPYEEKAAKDRQRFENEKKKAK